MAHVSEPELKAVLVDVKGINMLGLVVFSIAMGLAINHTGKKGLALKGLFDSLSEVTLVLVNVVIWSVLRDVIGCSYDCD